MSDKRARRAKRLKAEGPVLAGARSRPYVSAIPGPTYGLTNLKASMAHRETLGGPLEVGKLYRVGVTQGKQHQRIGFIGEYAGQRQDPEYPSEFGYLWILRNPPMPANAGNATEANPWLVWPLDLWHLSPAEPGDLEVVRPPPRVEGDPEPETVLSRLGLPMVPGGHAWASRVVHVHHGRHEAPAERAGAFTVVEVDAGSPVGSAKSS